MGGYLVKRLLLLIPMTLGITLITFFIVRLGGASTDEKDDAEQGRSTQRGGSLREKLMIEQFGDPDAAFFTQYLRWLSRTVQGNFGESLNDGQPVARKIREALPITITFNLISVFIIYLVALPIGMYSATHPGTRTDLATRFGLYALFSLPNFWVAILLIRYIGSSQSGLGLLPYSGVHPDGWRTMTTLQFFWHAIPYMILPLTCMTYQSFAGLSRYTRAGMIEVVRQDYIRTARAKGFSEPAVIL
ncbi:MAG TPA: ABC transporter permease, partial [Planctomycetota bacterium]|nr:ABC transporter permease [Planctomycetota bacterium]